MIALETWNIADFFPEPVDGSSLSGALGGIDSFLSIVAGFLPVVAPAISAAGIILSSANSYIDQAVWRQDSLVAQKSFAAIVTDLSLRLKVAPANAADALFQNGNFNKALSLSRMMQDGTWLDNRGITKVGYRKRRGLFVAFLYLKTNICRSVTSRRY